MVVGFDAFVGLVGSVGEGVMGVSIRGERRRSMLLAISCTLMELSTWPLV